MNCPPGHSPGKRLRGASHPKRRPTCSASCTAGVSDRQPEVQLIIGHLCYSSAATLFGLRR
jgi:hypothetical protein